MFVFDSHFWQSMTSYFVSALLLNSYIDTRNKLSIPESILCIYRVKARIICLGWVDVRFYWSIRPIVVWFNVSKSNSEWCKLL